jgi:hypothetical protein
LLREHDCQLSLATIHKVLRRHEHLADLKAGTIHGPYQPESGPIPFGTFRRWRKTERDRRLENIERLAKSVSIARDSMSRDRRTEEERRRVFDKQIPAPSSLHG